jgi:LmbE family N-acetylglucosaminyl deacetylase
MNNAYIISRLMQERDAAAARADAAEARVAQLEGALRRVRDEVPPNIVFTIGPGGRNAYHVLHKLVPKALAALTQEEPTDG